MQVVMYHYVRPSSDRPPHGYYHLALEDFRRQLDHLEAEYDFVDRETFLACATGDRSSENDRSPPDDAVVLTFDDGLADHYEWVLPELRSRDLFGVFFVPTGPLVGNGVLPVHRVHSLAGRHGATELRDALFDVLAEGEFADADGGTVGDPYGGRSTDDALTTFKRVLNFEVPYDRLGDVLDAVEASFGGGPSADDYYLSGDQLRQLRDDGMVVGAHSVGHPVLSRLSSADQRAEIASSFETLAERVGGLSARLFAYPYGSDRTFTDETKSLLEAVGCDAAFTTVSGRATPERFRNSRLALPRTDCNEFPHGGATFDLSP
ncbi:polysaccharide deacetylase family protein [Halorussus caseinilyticus]|uniref:Polysaccharide deacetylase family protein n=1 Tax=Halorussus caseinilyticus TaxID=3034025 RepID=A0ABD5WIU1_9EURY|nr:polysaccharide deacetylase family protein [Halorussus sp. DT72]